MFNVRFSAWLSWCFTVLDVYGYPYTIFRMWQAGTSNCVADSVLLEIEEPPCLE